MESVTSPLKTPANLMGRVGGNEWTHGDQSHGQQARDRHHPQHVDPFSAPHVLT